MDNIIEKTAETVGFLRAKQMTDIDYAFILGTGLNGFIEKIKIETRIPYALVPNFPIATVEFHKGELICGSIGGRRVIVMQGRFHYYEGYSMQEITFPVRVMKALGVRQLLLSNAAGGINKQFKKGDLVLLDDHINLLPENPLRGLNAPELGNRFVDMSCPYDQEMAVQLKAIAAKMQVNLRTGVYASVVGPNLETRAEYRYLDRIGADLVGMSTVPEVIVANHIGLPCAAISVVTDECDPDNLKPVNIAEIIKVAGEADKVLSELFAKYVENFHLMNFE